MTAPALAILTLLLAAGDEPGVLTPERLGRLDHPAIREASGVVASRKHPGVYWVHNDSLNPPALFAVRRDGSLVREYGVAAPNIDWEDIATDDHGHLYLGDIGNNDLRLPMRRVLRLVEPDPAGPVEPGSRPVLRVAATSYYVFPRGGRFDAEGLIVDRDGRHVWVVAKTGDGRDAEVYAVPFDPPAPMTKPATAEKVGTLPGFTEPVTGADLAPDGRLVVCSTRSVGVYRRDGEGRWVPLARRRFRVDDLVEAVAWDGPDLILAGEGRGVYRVREADWRLGAVGVGGRGAGHGR